MEPTRGRNLVICCDGTNNEFGERNTNVVRLVQLLDRDPATQLVYYDPGVGTMPEPSMWSKAGKAISKAWGLVFGTGLPENVEEAYTFLMQNWQPGDRVFCFGFSRGAYTVRVLAGMLHFLGLLPPGSHNLVPYAMRLYRGVRGRRAFERYKKVGGEFRRTFARSADGIPDTREFPTAFLGLWDTVSSVGWVWNQATYPFTAHNSSVGVIRHAIAIDERRSFYRQNRMGETPGQDNEELWFAGVHSDVGGGYPLAEGSLWYPPFEWLVRAAEAAGLRLDPQAKAAVLGNPPRTPWMDDQHRSLKWGWWLLELFPKFTFRRSLNRRVPTLGLGRRRRLEPGSLIHPSVLLRLRHKRNYAPRNLSEAFRTQVKALEQDPTQPLPI